jgi:hypothetical protein
MSGGTIARNSSAYLFLYFHMFIGRLRGNSVEPCPNIVAGVCIVLLTREASVRSPENETGDPCQS